MADLDPLAAATVLALAETYRDDAEAFVALLESLPSSPPDEVRATMAGHTHNAILTAFRAGRRQDACAIIRAHATRAAALGRESVHQQVMASTALAVAMTARDESAVDAVIAHLLPDVVTHDVLACNLACHYARRGDRARVIEYVERAISNGRSAQKIEAKRDLEPFLDQPEIRRLLGYPGTPIEGPAATEHRLMEVILDLDGPYCSFVDGDTVGAHNLGRPVEQGPARYLLEPFDHLDDPGHHPPQDAHHGDDGRVLFSPRLRRLLDDLGVDNVQYFPAEATWTHDGRTYPYFLANILGPVEAVDPRRTAVTFERYGITCHRLRLDEAALRGREMIALQVLDRTDFAVSVRVAEALAAADLRGVKLFRDHEFGDEDREALEREAALDDGSEEGEPGMRG